jgi:hypothetical protein
VDRPWIPFSEGIDIKVLRTSPRPVRGLCFSNAPKVRFARHEHLGSGEWKMEVRGGAQKGGITAYPGDYGYEPSGVIHDSTCFVEDSTFYFTNFGPIKFIEDVDKTLFVLDWQGVRAIEAQGKEKLMAAAAAE